MQLTDGDTGVRSQLPTSSIALSPPPMTARGFFRNMGAAPSHTAQAEMPLFQKPGLSPAPGKSNRLATAPASAAWLSLRLHDSLESPGHALPSNHCPSMAIEWCCGHASEMQACLVWT